MAKHVDVEITKTTSLLNVGYKVEEVEKIMELLTNQIGECTRQIRNIDLVLHNNVLLKQYDEHYERVLYKQRENFLGERKYLKCLMNKVTGEECFKHDELKDE